jgi:hypothetical protein
MNINVTITLGPNDDAGGLQGPAEIAAAVLTAVGGNESTDLCTVNINGSATVGSIPEPPADLSKS